MVDRLTNLISILEQPELDFSQNRAEHDNILGDANPPYAAPDSMIARGDQSPRGQGS